MKEFHHIAIVVDNIAKKSDWYCHIYGANKIGCIFIDKSQNVKVQFIKFNKLMIELLEPLNEDSPICTYLNKHGSGSIYHIAFQVDDLNKYEQEVRKNGGIIISKSKDGWNGMDVMFAMFFNDNEKHLIEYVVCKDNVV